MTDTQTKALLVVSFGTSFSETCKKNIEAIEEELRLAFPAYRRYRAWTSKMIMSKLLRTQGIQIDNVTQAMARMKADGIREVIIQPTHVINGIENDLMKEEALAFSADFDSITFGNPLITTDEDQTRVVEAVADEFSELMPGDMVVLMGHGTTHYSNTVYAALDYRFKDMGYKRFFLGTVEAYPSLDTLLAKAKELMPSHVILAPFMIVAGDHATNDLAGDEEDSWRSVFEAAGFRVSCVMKGLGEYPLIRQMFVDHARQAVERA